jgi:hypothetical protein
VLIVLRFLRLIGVPPVLVIPLANHREGYHFDHFDHHFDHHFGYVIL